MVIAHREKYFKTVSKSLWGRQGERGELGQCCSSTKQVGLTAVLVLC